jgi:hypothetical protein
MRPSLQNWGKVSDVTKVITAKKEEETFEVMIITSCLHYSGEDERLN